MAKAWNTSGEAAEAYVVTEALHMEHGDRYQFTVRSL